MSILYHFFLLPQNNQCHDVYDLINHSGLDMIPVVQFGKLMGVLRPQIVELEDENTLDAQLRRYYPIRFSPTNPSSPVTMA